MIEMPDLIVGRIATCIWCGVGDGGRAGFGRVRAHAFVCGLMGF